jgi:hypothetical protein
MPSARAAMRHRTRYRARFTAASVSLGRGCPGATEVGTLHTSVVWRAGAVRPGKPVARAGEVTATFIHTTLVRMRRPAPLRSFSSHLFSYGAPLTALVANPLFATSCVGTGAAMMIPRPLGDAGVRAPIVSPVSSAMIEWPTGVIVGPVCAKDERHDRHIDHVNIVRKIDVPVPIIVLEIVG